MMLEVCDLHIEIEDHIIPETVVNDFDLRMDEGEIVGIVGESGSGKSMSALAIAGLLSRKDMKKKGSIMFMDKELLTCPREELRKIQGNEISMVFQEPMTSLNPVRTVGWQIEESLRIHTQMTKEEMRQKTLQILADCELDDPEKVYSQYPHELSGGMRQRAMIAAALICNPKLLIADEPTTALDVTIQAQILTLLRKINKKYGTAILFISHDLSVVDSLCERVLVMNHGEIVESGLTSEVFHHPKQSYTKRLIEAIPGFEKQTEPDSSYDYSGSPLLLEVDHLNVYYPVKQGLLSGKKARKHVVKDATFSMKEGEIRGLVGESGCGKSTLGKAILGMIPDCEGNVKHYAKRPQMVFQDPYGSLNPAKTIGWILEEPLRVKNHLTVEERKVRVVEMLRLVGLDEHYITRHPNELSGGQRQRVCIAQALMQEPKLIIADEPVSALDVTVQDQILKLLVELNERFNIAILFISHDLKVVYELCDRVMVMKDGVIVENGTDKEIYFHPKEKYTQELLTSAGLKNF